MVNAQAHHAPGHVKKAYRLIDSSGENVGFLMLYSAFKMSLIITPAIVSPKIEGMKLIEPTTERGRPLSVGSGGSGRCGISEEKTALIPFLIPRRRRRLRIILARGHS